MPARSHILSALLLGAAAAQPTMLVAQNQARQTYDLPRQDLADALRSVAERGGLELYAASVDLEGRTSAPLEGEFTPREAVEALLRASGLVARFTQGTVTIVPAPADATGPNDEVSDPIVVTGSRIDGSVSAIPATVVNAEDIRNAGQNDLGDVARSLPQNFGGGQNPGIGTNQGAFNQNVNVNGASAFNLRGIGPNATLVLLNGNRFSSSGPNSVIDITAIPVAAVDRIETVADGTSAIYGADAVAGVVNILLRRDYSGLETSARLGKSTDGGNFQQQYNVLGGIRWGTGAILATYDYSQNSEITAGQRRYASANNPDNTLYPAMRRHSLLASGNQELGEGVSASADFYLKSSEIEVTRGLLRDQPVTFRGTVGETRSEAFGFTPGLQIDFGSGWSADLTGHYGAEKTTGESINYAGAVATTSARRFDNRSISLEAGIQGPLLVLPAGDLRIAAGGGLRRNELEVDQSARQFTVSRENYFAYGEMFVPLASPDQSGPIHRASITAALRWEDYSDSGSIVTPKVGFVLEPSDQLRLGASWGNSFKLASLFQQNSGYVTLLLPISGYGSAFPAGSNFLFVLGADPDLGPERAENWSFNATLRPSARLDVTATVFRIDYRDRVAPPFTSSAGKLTDPVYAQLVTRNPSVELQNRLIADAQGGLQNGTGGAYNPANVAVVLDGRDRNIAEQRYQGVDLSVGYTIPLGERRSVQLTAAGSWLESEQRLLPGLPTTKLAGTIFNPPFFRGRAGITYASDSFTLSGFVNRVGGVEDNRRPLAVDVSPVATIDLVGRLKLGDLGEVAISALNILDARPDPIFTASPADGAFDTTNYSSIGRFVSLTLRRKW